MLLSLIENAPPPQKPPSSHTKLSSPPFLHRIDGCCPSPFLEHEQPLHLGSGPVSDNLVGDPVEDVEDEEGQGEGRSGDGVDSLRSVHKFLPVVLGVPQDRRLLDSIGRGALHRHPILHARGHAVAGEMEACLPQLLLLDTQREEKTSVSLILHWGTNKIRHRLAH